MSERCRRRRRLLIFLLHLEHCVSLNEFRLPYVTLGRTGRKSRSIFGQCRCPVQPIDNPAINAMVVKILAQKLLILPHLPDRLHGLYCVFLALIGLLFYYFSVITCSIQYMMLCLTMLSIISMFDHYIRPTEF